jgi:hypothetical protein
VARAREPARRDLHPSAVGADQWPNQPCPTARGPIPQPDPVARTEARRCSPSTATRSTISRAASPPSGPQGGRGHHHGGMGREER